ncbi:MAG TPA: hypothetical protein VIA02_06790 [Candidatus Limnocylindria bacterium]|jgi:hypothetical protein
MTELLTESFCERCGNRYEFGSAEPMSRKQKTRGLVTGLRQFIMSTDSLEDSLTDAMRAEEESLAARQIDAFQETFNFCFDCRRYTCLTCWNDDAGRCRSCVPVPGIDDLVAMDQPLANPIFQPTETDEMPLLTTTEEPAWPAEEVVPPAPPVTAAPALEWPSEDDIVQPVAAEAEPVAEPIAEPEPELEVAAEAEPEELPEPVVVPGFAAEAEPEPEVTEPEVEEPIAAAAEEEPEPAPIEPPTPVAPRRDLRDTFVRGPMVARPAAEPQPETLAARRSQLDALGIDDPGQGQVPVGQRDALPYRSSGAGSAAGSAALAAVWDASVRALEASSQRAAIRPCGACGLTVSSTARFCRRCGAPQTLSA